MPVLAFDTTQVTSPGNYSHPKLGDPCHPLCAGAHAPAIAYSIAGNVIGRENQNGGHHMGVDKDVSFTLNTVDRHAVCVGNGQLHQGVSDKAGALNCMHDQQAVMVAAVDCRNGREQNVNGTLQAKPNGGTSLNLNNVVRQMKSVRRLTPTECERLQGLEDGKIKAEIDIDDLVYLFNTNRENLDGEKPAALVRPEQKLEFAKAVVKQLQEQSQGERDCIRWAEPIEDIFGEFLEEDQSFLKYGEIDGFTEKEIKEWEKCL